MANQDIRRTAASAGVKLWQIAEASANCYIHNLAAQKAGNRVFHYTSYY